MTLWTTGLRAFLDAPPVLPALGLTAWANAVAWALVLAVCMVRWTSWAPRRLRWALALGVAVWALVPGPLAPGYWLGLTFRAPSIVSCLLAALGLWRLRASAREPQRSAPATGAWAYGPWLALALGYLLLLDTLALLPFQLYAWGFAPWTLGLLGAAALLPWFRGETSGTGPVPAATWVLPVALLLFVITRWPSGNVWDAVSDPCLFLYLHSVAWRQWRARRRSPAN